MLNLFIPSSKYQLEQFKLYTDNFKEELEDEIEKMYIVVRKQTINLPKCFGLNEKNPYEKLIDNSNKLIERAQYGKKQKELLENLKGELLERKENAQSSKIEEGKTLLKRKK